MKAAPGNQMVEDTQLSKQSDLSDNDRDLERLKGDKAVFDLPGVEDIPGQENYKEILTTEMAGGTIASADEEGKDIFENDNFDEEDNDEFPGRDYENSVVIDTEEDEEENGDDDDDDDDEADLLNDENEDEEDFGEDDKRLYDVDNVMLADQDINDDYDESRDNVAVKQEEMNADIPAAELALLDQSGSQMPDSDSVKFLRSRLDDTDMEGDPLNEESFEKNLDGTDLDVPGVELDDENESLGEEDEENNIYSKADTG